MKLFTHSFLLFSLLPLSIYSSAQESLTVQGMQLPAWHISNGEKKALRLDANIIAGDEIHTGEGARLLALTPDGSDLKLGSEARFIVQELAVVDDSSSSDAAASVQQSVPDQSEKQASPLSATLEVRKGVYSIPEGAFRFATRLALKYLKRDIEVKVGFSTVGIRGTDFWGKSDASLDTVCLIEGAIAIDKAGQSTIEMDQPLTFYRSRKGGATEPVAPVDPNQLADWATSVELQSSEGVLSSEGSWLVYLGAFSDELKAIAMQSDLDVQGYPAEVVSVNDGALHRVVIKHFDSYSDALSFVDIADARLGVSGAWLSQMN